MGYEQFVRMEARQSTDTVAGWLDQLKDMQGTEADPVAPDRSDRSDQFGEDWE